MKLKIDNIGGHCQQNCLLQLKKYIKS